MNTPSKTINIKELSFLTGYSISTVSKALNDKAEISEKTKRLISCIAQKHNYIPNSLAAGLRNRKSSTVAVIVPQINVDFYSNILANFQKIADRHNHRIIVFQSFNQEDKEIEYLKSICDGSIDSAIIITNFTDNIDSSKCSIPLLAVPINEAISSTNLDKFCKRVFNKLLTHRA